MCCTGGEEGEVLNPALDTPEVHARPGRGAAGGAGPRPPEVIGYDEVVMLGYRDSGMAGSEANANPDCFAQAPLDEAVGRLVAIVRRTRPQVMVIYGDEQSGYPHPDHLRVHEIGRGRLPGRRRPGPLPRGRDGLAADQALLHRFSAARFREIHEKFEELGLESPFDDGVAEALGGDPDAPLVTTSVDISEFADIRRRALLAHATQVDPKSQFWFGLPPEVMRHHPPPRRLPAGPGGRSGRRRHRPPESGPEGREGPVEDRPVRRGPSPAGIARTSPRP